MQVQQNAVWESTPFDNQRRVSRGGRDIGAEFGTGLEFNTEYPCSIPKSSTCPSLCEALKGSLTPSSSSPKPSSAKRKLNKNVKRLIRLTRMASISPTRKKPTRKDSKDCSTNSSASHRRLPDKSLISGKGSDNQTSFIRILSERSLVKKISQSLPLTGSFHSAERFGSTSSFTADISTGSPEHDQDDFDSTGSTFRSVNGQSFQMPSSAMKGGRAEPVPSLHLKELEIGELLGEGGFSKVLALDGIHLMRQQEFEKRVQRQQRQMSDESDTWSDISDLDTSLRHSLAEQCSTQRPDFHKEVASKSLVVKHLNRKLLRKPKEFQQAAMDLAREAQILSILDCEFIIKLRAVSLGGTTALESGRFNNFFLVLDRLDDTLDARITRWKESPPDNHYLRATEHAIELASALEYLHERNLCYRDTKPPNVGFLSQAGPHHDKAKERVQLFDFGLCTPLGSNGDNNDIQPSHYTTAATPHDPDATYAMSTAGTIRYESPEMQQGQPYNCKTDVYSFAITFTEMLSLQQPFAEILRRSQFQEYICVMDKRPTLPTDLPPSIHQLLQDAWCTSIPARLSMKQVRERLQQIAEELS